MEAVLETGLFLLEDQVKKNSDEKVYFRMRLLVFHARRGCEGAVDVGQPAGSVYLAGEGEGH